MASTYERLVVQIQNARQWANARYLHSGASTPRSEWFLRLVEEVHFSPPTNEQEYGTRLSKHLQRVRDEFTRAREERERNESVRSAYQRIESRLAAEYEAATPFSRFEPEKVVEQTAQVAVRLGAVRHLISRIPTPLGAGDIWDETEAVNAAREKEIGRLVAWRDRLRKERDRLRDEINALPAGEAAALLANSAFEPHPLRDDLEVLMSALSTAERTLGKVR